MRRFLLAILLFACCGLAAAKPGVDVGGELSSEFGVAFDGTVSVASATLTLRASGEVGAGLFPDASFEAELIGSYDGAAGGGEVRLGKAYATVYLKQFDVIAGQQIIAWGTTDALSPVDVLNPRDLSFPVADPADDKLPIPALRVILHAPEGLTVDSVLVPVFEASVAPAARWQTTAAPALPPGVQIVGQEPTDDERPGVELANVQFGVRATLDLDVLAGADVSLAYVHGIKTVPTVSVRLVPTPTAGEYLAQSVLSYDRYDLVGVDFSAATSWAVFRGEAAYTFTHDPNGTDPTIGNPGYQAVLEVEHTFPSGLLGQLEAIVEHTRADQGGTGQTTVSGLVTLHYEPSARASLEASWLFDLNDGSGMLRPHLDYAFADGVHGTADLYVFYGRDGSRYGAWKDNGQLRVGLTYAF
ncbi:MAG: hypothetical protein P8Z81_09795 [Deinococcales bacterium]